MNRSAAAALGLLGVGLLVSSRKAKGAGNTGAEREPPGTSQTPNPHAVEVHTPAGSPQWHRGDRETSPVTGAKYTEPVPMEVIQRMAAALATNDPNVIRAEADRLNVDGYNEQAEDMLRAAVIVEKAQQQGKTPATTRPPATSSTTPRVLMRGMSGPDVKAWQLQLVKDGIRVDTDGAFGLATEAATQAWQAQRGLNPDGKVGPDTRAAIGRPPLLAPTEPGGVIVTPKGPLINPGGPQLQVPFLKVGSRGVDVTAWQHALRAEGFGASQNKAVTAAVVAAGVSTPDPEVATDGIFGANTDKATRILQTDHGLSVDGIVGPATRGAIGKQPLLGRRLLRQGSRGPAVKVWQAQLVSDGFAHVVDGIFGPVTHGATVEWQRNRKLSADGVVGPNTIAAIGSRPVPRATSPAPAITAPTPLMVDPDKWRLMRRGTAGKDVAEWQMVLNRDGYGPLETDGKFGPATEAATKQWQIAHGLMPPDGVVGPATRAKIEDREPTSGSKIASRVMGDPAPAWTAPREFKATSPLPGLIPVAVPTEQVPADRSFAARVALHLFNVRPGDEDRELLEEFQRAHGLNPTGTYGPATALALAPYGLVPPKPFYWPRKGLLKAKATYRLTLMAQSKRDPQRADEWAAAANV